MNFHPSSLSLSFSHPSPRVCVSASRRWWRCTSPTGVRPERTGPSTCFPHKTGKLSVFLLWTVYSRGFPSSPSAPTETNVQLFVLIQKMEAGAAVNPFVCSHSAVFCLLRWLVSDVNTSFRLAFCYSRQSYWLWPPSCGCSLCLCHSVFSSCRCTAGRNTPERNTKEKWLSHPIAHSLDSPCADGHSREAGTGGCVLASWQVPSVMQGLCVLVVLGHKVCSVPACLRRSICRSLPCLCLVTPFTSECRWEHMSSRTNEKYKLNWTDRDGIKPRREAASQAGRGSHTRSRSMWMGRSARFGSDSWRDSVLSSHISTLIPAARDQEQQ